MEDFSMHDISCEKNSQIDMNSLARGIFDKNQAITSSDAFPIGAFPRNIQQFINEIAIKKAIPMDYACASVLSAFSTAAGKKIRLQHDNYTNYPCVWIAIVGESGTNKSEPITQCFNPISDRDSELFEEYENQKGEYEAFKELTKKEKMSREKVNNPLIKQHLIKDITFETMYDCFQGNHSGMCALFDELITWIMDMERYGNKSQQSKWLSMFSHIDISYLRKQQKVRIKKPFINILGGIQTDLLKELAEGNRAVDGTIHRILFVFPERVFQQKPEGAINDSIISHYEQCIRGLLDMSFHEEPFVIEKGMAEIKFNSFNDYLRNRLNSLPECSERKFIAKLQIYFYRLTLLMHIIEHSHNIDFMPKQIDEKIVESAIAIIRYFHETAQKVTKVIETRTRGIDEKELLIHLREKTGRGYKEIIDFCGSDVKEGTYRQWCNRYLKN